MAQRNMKIQMRLGLNYIRRIPENMLIIVCSSKTQLTWCESQQLINMSIDQTQ